MKIRTQFIISMTVFSVVLLIVAASIIVTNEQIRQLDQQQDISWNIERGADELNTLSSQYFLYQQTQQLTLWQSNIGSISGNLSKLNPNNSEQQTAVNNARDDLSQLNAAFTDVVSFLETAPRNVSVRVLPEFQDAWNRMITEHQAFALDSSQLSESLRTQANQLRLTSAILIIVLLGIFGAFLIINYLITYRRTLKSISSLQAGINVIGSGDLDYSIKTDKEDEIAELSNAFNQMTANLKTLTASKTELEKEIMERKRTEQALLDSERRLNRSQEIAHLGSWELDLINNRLTWSDEVYRIFGLKPQEFGATYEAFLDAVHPDDRAAVDAAYSGSLREGRDSYEIEHRIVRKPSDEIRIVHEKCNHIRDESGRTIRSVGMVYDITERKKAEEAFVQAEKRYRRLFETSQDGIMARDLEGRMIECNQAYAKMLGYTKEELAQLTVQRLLPEEWYEQREKIVKEVLAKGGSVVFEREYRRKDGSIFPASVRSWRLTDEKGKIVGIWSIVRDITDQKELQKKLEQQTKNLETLVEERTKQLKESERLAAIGQTAGMVGHDIRNPLQAIISDIYLIDSELEAFPESEAKTNIKESLHGINDCLNYVNKIVADLQDFAKPLNPVVQETNIEEIVEELLLKTEIPQNIKAYCHVDKNAETIQSDPFMLKRILNNLITNAVQAMPKGGELTVRVQKESNDIVVAIQDTGEGIPEDVKPKLFTPLFTTKSKGQGFGLAVVKRMTEALGGTIRFESQKGKGTTFILYFPR